MSAEDDKDLIEILENQNSIDFAKYMKFISAPQAGAIATFAGTTRHTFEGKPVLELRYEAYIPMAIRCIKEVYSNGEIWKENTEFSELGIKDGKKVEIKEEHEKRRCCGTKVRVDGACSKD